METLVEVNDLYKSYGDTHVLKNINLQLKKGAIVGLLGPNGSGKTTLIKTLTGILKNYTGEIRIDGYKIGKDTKKIVSYLPDHEYFENHVKVKQAIAMFKDLYEDFDDEKCKNLLSKFKISETDKIKSMSKGTKEKLQLALVISRNAKLIILDEPIGGVDPASREVILDTVLENYNPEQTILIATHLISEVEKIFSEVILLKEGEIVLHDDVESIRMSTNKSINELFIDTFK